MTELNTHQSPTIKILLVEDNPRDADLFRAMLGQSLLYEYDVNVADRMVQATRYLSKNTPELILLDLFLPESKGLDTLNRINRVAPHIPIVVLTKMDDEQTGINSVREGAQDYLVKGQVNAVILSRTIHYSIERKQVSEQLSSAHSQLERLDRLKNEFISILSHDLRTPVASVIGSAETLIEGMAGPVNEKQQQILGVIQRKGGWMMRMLNDLLDLSRIEAGVFVSEFRRLDLRNTLKFLAEDLATDAKQLTVKIPDQPVWAMIDYDRTLQAVQNLVTNALRFASSEVILQLEHDDKRIKIRVTDDGPGIPEKDIHHIFQRFARSTVNTDKSQTGLGLSIAQAIVESHHGKLTVSNLSNENDQVTGAEFIIELPFNQALQTLKSDE